MMEVLRSADKSPLIKATRAEREQNLNQVHHLTPEKKGGDSVL